MKRIVKKISSKKVKKNTNMGEKRRITILGRKTKKAVKMS